jgi:hypothetical protein
MCWLVILEIMIMLSFLLRDLFLLCNNYFILASLIFLSIGNIAQNVAAGGGVI